MCAWTPPGEERFSKDTIRIGRQPPTVTLHDRFHVNKEATGREF